MPKYFNKQVSSNSCHGIMHAHSRASTEDKGNLSWHNLENSRSDQMDRFSTERTLAMNTYNRMKSKRRSVNKNSVETFIESDAHV